MRIEYKSMHPLYPSNFNVPPIYIRSVLAVNRTKARTFLFIDILACGIDSFDHVNDDRSHCYKTTVIITVLRSMLT